MPNFKEEGSAFLNRILAHVAETDRADLAAKLGASPALLEALGKDAAAVAAVESERGRLNVWFNTNKDALERAKPLLAAHAAGKLRMIDADDDDDDPDANDPLGLKAGRRRAAQPAGMTETDVQARIAAAVSEARIQTETEGLSLITKMTRTGLQHFKEFNEVLDTEALTDFAIKNGLRLDIAYDQMVKPLRDTRDKTASDAALVAAEERGKVAGRAEALNRTVPVPAGGNVGSTLSGLATEGKVDGSVAGLRGAYAEAVAGTLV